MYRLEGPGWHMHRRGEGTRGFAGSLDRLTQKECPFDCSQNETGDEWMDTGSLA